MSRKLLGIIVGLLVGFVLAFGINFGLAAAGAEPLSSAWVVAAVVGSSVSLAIANTGGNKRMKIADPGLREAALAEVKAGTARIVLFREGFMGKRNGIDLLLDGRDIAQLKSPQFTAVTVAPGRHTIRAALAGTMNAGSKPGEVAIDLASGQTATFRITLAMKMTTSDVVLARIDEPAVAHSKLARMPMVVAAAP